MPSHTYRARTKSAPEATFDFMADLRNTARWLPMVGSVGVRSDSWLPEVGTCFDVRATPRWGGTTMGYEVVDLERPHRVVWRVTHRSIDHAREVCTVEPMEDGTTQVTYHTEVRAKGVRQLAGPVMTVLFAKYDSQVRRNLTRELDALTTDR